MSRITLITKFKENELNKINNQLKNINHHMCKVPYGINDELRNEIDNLPYHFTIFATDKQNESKLLNIASDIKMNKIKEEIELSFKPFRLVFDELVLYDYPGDMIKEISIK